MCAAHLPQVVFIATASETPRLVTAAQVHEICRDCMRPRSVWDKGPPRFDGWELKRRAAGPLGGVQMSNVAHMIAPAREAGAAAGTGLHSTCSKPWLLGRKALTH